MQLEPEFEENEWYMFMAINDGQIISKMQKDDLQ